MEIDYYDEDFCEADLDEVDIIEVLQLMEDDLQADIWKQEHKLASLKTNMGIVQNRINEVENET